VRRTPSARRAWCRPPDGCCWRDQELLIDLLIGPIWTRLLITRDPITAEYVDSIVKAVLTAFDVKPATGASPSDP